MYGMMAVRRIDICPTTICKIAGIARSSFYAHYNSRNFIEQHELKLIAKFLIRLPKTNSRKVMIFTILLSFVREECKYFDATMPNANFWLLKQIFEELRPILMVRDCGQKSYDLYVMRQIALISCWVQHDECVTEKLGGYAQKMAAVPVMRVEI